MDTCKLFIAGDWCNGSAGETIAVINPATGEAVAQAACATKDDLDRALAAADTGFRVWSRTSPWERAQVLNRCAALIAERMSDLAVLMTREQGKPLAESMGELDRTVDVFQWCAGEAIRTYGRLLPQRGRGFRQTTIKEPVGPVAAFAPWNFPGVMFGRKVAAALGAGCSLIIKPSEESPSVSAGIVRACQDAGVPDGVLNMVMGDPAMISEHLIRSPVIAKVSLTGSVAVGRQLSALAGEMLKPATMELGGHAPVLVFADADPEKAADMTAAFKYRNAGQVCLGVSRIYVHEQGFDRFLARFQERVAALKVGNGMDDGVTMGPLANARGVAGMEKIMDDLSARGARILSGGHAIGNRGHFWAPTVVTDLDHDSRIMTQEPFGPIAPVVPFSDYDEAVARANGLSYGLAAYAFTRSLDVATNIADDLEAGWIGINNFSPALAEAPFGGVKDSGFGYEGGPEGFDAYCRTRFISQCNMDD
ncbi:NAD-dependent succinate-semialdehyde dehydrogenase [uncultured Roseobacter sp.]|uniref:NAD-dependent succinate-semialdehyde dehydrogenase n=1 Tax=uncultured Roseobacter sp. TaxID=114847 RepID=UPI00261588FF|nr:NAD-dependent succinate-semialdehyde dehydrogenase [uncultured Roseobacter sp.]